MVVVGLSFFKDVPGLEMTAIPPSFGVNADASGWKITIPVSLRMDDKLTPRRRLGLGSAELKSRTSGEPYDSRSEGVPSSLRIAWC